MSNHPRNRPQETQLTINIVYCTVFKMLHRSIHSFKMKLMEGGTSQSSVYMYDRFTADGGLGAELRERPFWKIAENR